MTFLMLLSARFYQGQKTRRVRKHKPRSARLGGGGLGAGKIKPSPRGLGNELVFPTRANPSHWVWDSPKQHPRHIPPAEPLPQPPGWVSPQRGAQAAPRCTGRL